MNLFIDTNVLLNFFHLSGEDIEELRKLIQLVDHKKLTLWVPSQICDEFQRNRETKIFDAMKAVTKSLKLIVPAFYKNSDTYAEIADDLNKLNKKYAKLHADVASQVEGVTLDADVLIEDLFKKANVVTIDEDLIDSAVDRWRRGNPPGKKSGASVGDELNWETLLHAVPKGEDLHIVSVDGDYASILDENRLNSFLAAEWTAQKNGTATLYRGLSSFFATHFKTIKLAADVAKTTAIERLAKSSSFVRTHSAIAKLTPFLGSFTADEASTLVDILNDNPQVLWILSDQDIEDFYEGLLATAPLDPLSFQKLSDLMLPDETANTDEPVPF